MREDWVQVELSEVFKIVTGNTPSKKEKDNYGSDIPFIKPPDINNKPLSTASEYLSKKGAFKGRILPPFSVLVTCIGNLGRVTINKEKIAFNQQINALKPLPLIDSKFIYYTAQSGSFRSQLEAKSTSTTVALVNKGSFGTINISIAPLPEQRAIVSKLEGLFTDLDQGIADLKKAQAQLKVYRQAVLKKAFEGEFESIRLGDITDIRGGVTKGRKLGDRETIDLPYLRVANVQDGYLDLSVIKTISVLPSDLEKYQLDYEDILFTEGGDRDKLGRGTVWKNEIDECIHQNHIFRSRVKDRSLVSPYYLTYYAQSPDGKDFFFQHGKHTTNLASINKTVLSNLPVPLPPLTAQHQMVREIESRLSVCDAVEESINEGLKKAEALRQSILKKAFEGTLLSKEELAQCRQEADWEPAEKLMERIQNERSIN